MDFVHRRRIEMLTRIRDHAHDRVPGLPVVESKSMPDRILRRPETARERLVNDRDQRRGLRVAAVESASAQQCLPHRFEIILAAHLHLGGSGRRVRLQRPGLPA